MECPLCLQHVILPDRARYFELELCNSCKSGSVAPAAEGPSFRYRARFENPSSNDAKHPPRIVVHGEVATVSPVKLHAIRSNGLTKLADSLFGRQKTGDDIFDDHVWVWAKRIPALTALLARESVRSSLLDCTADGRVSIHRGVVRCSRASPGLGHHDMNETVRGVLILLHYLSSG